MANGLSDPNNPLFQRIRGSALRQIRGTVGRQAVRQAQNQRLAGFRTSGAGLRSREDLARRRAELEAGVERGLAESQFGQAGALERLDRRGQIQERLARSDFDRKRNLAREQARQRLQTALISGAFQLPASFLGGFGQGVGGRK